MVPSVSGGLCLCMGTLLWWRPPVPSLSAPGHPLGGRKGSSPLLPKSPSASQPCSLARRYRWSPAMAFPGGMGHTCPPSDFHCMTFCRDPMKFLACFWNAPFLVCSANIFSSLLDYFLGLKSGMESGEDAVFPFTILTEKFIGRFLLSC